MNRDERQQRDARVLELFVAGYSFSNIAAALGVKPSLVHALVKRELARAAQRRLVLGDEALAIYQERTERLFKAYWGPALKGDHKAAEVCTRLLGRYARLYGLETILDTPPPPDDDVEDEPQDELAKLRAERA